MYLYELTDDKKEISLSYFSSLSKREKTITCRSPQALSGR